MNEEFSTYKTLFLEKEKKEIKKTIVFIKADGTHGL